MSIEYELQRKLGIYTIIKDFSVKYHVHITARTVVQAVVYAMGQVNGRGRFSTPPHSSETPQPIFIKLEIYYYLRDTIPHAKF